MCVYEDKLVKRMTNELSVLWSNTNNSILRKYLIVIDQLCISVRIKLNFPRMEMEWIVIVWKISYDKIRHSSGTDIKLLQKICTELSDFEMLFSLIVHTVTTRCSLCLKICSKQTRMCWKSVTFPSNSFILQSLTFSH